jgi:hypothetical protein
MTFLNPRCTIAIVIIAIAPPNARKCISNNTPECQTLDPHSKRIENHAIGTGNVVCQLYDFPFLGMIFHDLYNFCLLACFPWGPFWSFNFQIQIVLHILYAFILIKNYKIICWPNLLGALRMPLRCHDHHKISPQNQPKM